MRNAVTVAPVRTDRDLAAFVEVPFDLYRCDPLWVAPIRSDLLRRLDPDRNPFFEHAEAAYFLARRGDRSVGRISAHTDASFDRIHADEPSTGFFGFFECENDADAALALFDAAEEWLASRGRVRMIGPASFTLNDEAGLLVDGFDSSPMIFMTYNPDYYELLVGKGGFERAQDLWAYRLDATAEPPPEMVAWGEEAAERFTFRPIDMKRFDRDLLAFMDVYNASWERNWGFAPVSEAEIHAHAKDLRPLIDPRLVIVVEDGASGETAAVGLTLPNLNEALIRAKGRLGPVSAARILWKAKRRRWEACRVFALGVKPAYRQTGVGARLYCETLAAARRAGYRWGEMSWILESNVEMNHAIRHMGGTIYKTYRMYERPIPFGGTHRRMP
jgi:hypothetical protein